MEDVLARLIEVRGDMTQAEFARLNQVSVATQQNYEYGKTQPNLEYFLQLLANGFDAMYILTGERVATHLSTEEALLLQDWRRASPLAQFLAVRCLHIQNADWDDFLAFKEKQTQIFHSNTVYGDINHNH